MGDIESPDGYSLVDGIRGCSKVLGCFFAIFGIPSRPNTPNLQDCVHFGKFGQKSTQFVPNWVVFFAPNWYSDGSQNHTFRGI